MLITRKPTRHHLCEENFSWIHFIVTNFYPRRLLLAVLFHLDVVSHCFIFTGLQVHYSVKNALSNVSVENHIQSSFLVLLVESISCFMLKQIIVLLCSWQILRQISINTSFYRNKNFVINQKNPKFMI